ncbi:MAG TPA: preprotein translocase subunit SecG [Polyangia bacterium]|jgi:preprotein translocase subunit SecG
MITFLTVIHVVVCLFLVLVVLLQAGKGGGMGIAFGGGGGSQTVFGSSGAGNFLTRLTSITALIFLLTSLGLAHFSSQQDSRRLEKLAERKSEQKKAEDARNEKLKLDLDKARDTIQKTAGGAAAGTPAPGASQTSEPAAPAAPVKAEEPKSDKTTDQTSGKTEGKTAKGAKPAKPSDKASDTEAAPATPVRRHKRAAAPAEGEKPAEAPASPAPAPASPAPAPAAQ